MNPAIDQSLLIEGIPKRVVATREGKEMSLRFARVTDIEGAPAAWQMKTPVPYSIRAVTQARVAALPVQRWLDFTNTTPSIREAFDQEVMRVTAEVMSHTITLHLLDAAGRVHRFQPKHPDVIDYLPQRELAAHLNITPETLSRLKRRGRI